MVQDTFNNSIVINFWKYNISPTDFKRHNVCCMPIWRQVLQLWYEENFRIKICTQVQHYTPTMYLALQSFAS